MTITESFKWPSLSWVVSFSRVASLIPVPAVRCGDNGRFVALSSSYGNPDLLGLSRLAKEATAPVRTWFLYLDHKLRLLFRYWYPEFHRRKDSPPGQWKQMLKLESDSSLEMGCNWLLASESISKVSTYFFFLIESMQILQWKHAWDYG